MRIVTALRQSSPDERFAAVIKRPDGLPAANDFSNLKLKICFLIMLYYIRMYVDFFWLACYNRHCPGNSGRRHGGTGFGPIRRFESCRPSQI